MRHLLYFFVIFGGLLFVSCEDDEEPGVTGPEVTGIEIQAPATEMVIDETIVLTAVVSPATAPQGVDWSSADPTILAVDNTGQVTALSAGTSSITATSTADPDVSESITIEVSDCPTPRELPRFISSDLTLENWIASKACIDYVAGRSSIENAIVTIEPGVRLAFNAGRSMVFRGSDVAINAVGTEDDPIIFTGLENERGHWGALLLDGANNPENRLEHIILEYGGVADISGSIFQAGLILMGDTETTLRNVTVRESASYGLAMMNSASLTDYGNNTFIQNASGPAHVYVSQVHFLDPGSSGNGNDNDNVLVYPTDISEAVTWVPFGEGYVIEKRSDSYAFDIRGAEASLTLQAGVRLLFEEDMAITVADNASITANGTESAPVIMSGLEETPGYWRGFRTFSENPDQRFEYVVVEYAGGDTHSGSVQPANVWVGNDASLTISNSVFREGVGYGLVAEDNASLPDFNGNALTTNALGAAHVRADVAEDLTNTSDYTGNTIDLVHVLGYTNRLNEPTVWEDLGVPYVLRGQEGLYVDDVTFTIEEGTQILFEGNIGLAVIGGTLQVNGTETNPVQLGGEGYPWKGILVERSNATFEHTIIDYAGSDNWNQFPAGAVSIFTAQDDPSSAAFGEGTTHSNTIGNFGLVFSYGNTTANCLPMEPVSIPTGDSEEEHCR